MMAQSGGLGTQAVQGTLWAYGSFASGKLLVFISTIILALSLIHI